MYNNSGDFMKKAFKLLLCVLFSDFAALMITISFSVIIRNVNWAFYTLSQLFSFIILVTLVWQTVYEIGFRDSNMVRTGHMQKDLYKGFKMGLVANAPWFIILVMSFVINMRFSIYRVINSVYWTFLTVFCNAFNNRAATIHMRDIGVLGIIGTVLLLLIVPAISGAVYLLGFSGIDLFSKIVYKKRKG